MNHVTAVAAAAAAATTSSVVLPRLIAITTEGVQRSSVEPVLTNLCTRRESPLFSQVHFGSSIDDFAQIDAITKGTDPLVVIIGAPSCCQILKFLMEQQEQQQQQQQQRQQQQQQRIKLVHSLFTGIDGLNPELLRRLLVPHNIPLSNARGVYSPMLAEHVLLSILYFTRGVARLQANRKAKIWDRFASPTASQMTLLVVGFGDIGKCCAKRAIGGLDMKVVGVRSLREGEDAPKPEEKCVETGARVVFGNDAMDALLPEADVVLAVLPNIPSTQNVFDEKRFAKFKKGSIFINIGRGQTVDEGALVTLLKKRGGDDDDDGLLRGAALDVFAQEPLPRDSPFWGIDDSKLLLTPHNADISPTMFQDSANYFAKHVAEKFVLEGKLPEYLVDLEKGY